MGKKKTTASLTSMLTLSLILVAFAPYPSSAGIIIEDYKIRQYVKDGLAKIKCESVESYVTDCVLKAKNGNIEGTDCDSSVIEPVETCFKDGLAKCRKVSPEDLTEATGEIKNRLKTLCLALLGISIVIIIVIVICIIALISIICCLVCCLCRKK